jgi:predicted phosphodiesterase
MEEVKATTAWAPTDLEPIMHIRAPRIGVLSDVHCPMHSEHWLLLAVKTFIHYKVEDIVINGDFIDANQISKHAGSYKRRGTLEDDLDAAEAVLKLLSKYFKRIYINAGNHDMRLVHKMGGELSFRRMMKMIYDNEQIKVTARSYIYANDNVALIHPRQYSKIRGKTPSDLAYKIRKHVVTGHEHHSASSVSLCGGYQGCDVGTLVNIESQDYIKNEITTHAEPLNGFAIVFGEKIQLFDKFTNWEILGIDFAESI